MFQTKTGSSSESPVFPSRWHTGRTSEDRLKIHVASSQSSSPMDVTTTSSFGGYRGDDSLRDHSARISPRLYGSGIPDVSRNACSTLPPTIREIIRAKGRPARVSLDDDATYTARAQAIQATRQSSQSRARSPTPTNRPARSLLNDDDEEEDEDDDAKTRNRARYDMYSYANLAVTKLLVSSGTRPARIGVRFQFAACISDLPVTKRGNSGKRFRIVIRFLLARRRAHYAAAHAPPPSSRAREHSCKSIAPAWMSAGCINLSGGPSE